jgi:hypothetical protein
LSWRQGTGKGRHIVGVLKRNSTKGVSFAYIEEGVEEAKKEGFTPYTEFPDLNKEYDNNVLEIFGQRIIKSEREDIKDFWDFWEIDPDHIEDKFYLLAHTQGLTPTDNFEFLADYNPTKTIRFLTDIAGLTSLKLPLGIVKVGDILTYRFDSKNQYDKNAIKVFKGETFIGYIKKIHSRVFYKTKAKILKLKVIALDQNGVVKRIFLKVCS